MPKGSSGSAGTGKDLNQGDAAEGKRFVFRTFAKQVAAANIDVHHSRTGMPCRTRQPSMRWVSNRPSMSP